MKEILRNDKNWPFATVVNQSIFQYALHETGLGVLNTRGKLLSLPFD